ncbi:hypothetical protein, partial [Pseudomonas aeruginosa]|uniref:hypothetical protein n=1 Tax=Pseudomonas aeruginosa TaxID=287 RepID=UPI001CB744B3
YQEQLLAGLLALTGVLGIGEGHLFHHRKARRLVSGDFAKSGSLFQDFLSSLRSGLHKKSGIAPRTHDLIYPVQKEYQHAKPS